MDPNGATLPRFAPGHSGGWPHAGGRRRSRGVCRAVGAPHGSRPSGAAGRRVAGAVVFGLVAAALTTRCVRRVVVEGASMAPTLLDGDRLVVLARPWGPPARPAVGELVAVPDPRRPARVLVKRVASVDWTDRTLVVLGDAPDASTDSRHFGPVPLRSVIGRVVHRYGPPGRSGPVGRPTEYDRA